ncbi:unnamed protein product [Periconia digitata]|uniref:Uncharacterized protein n=1 Tax=Periconia digitata TaxID=1303443 RepID=A0A9W4UEI8_9PLEO|nr:unnamed protein product [Periconia digitata]
MSPPINASYPTLSTLSALPSHSPATFTPIQTTADSTSFPIPTLQQNTDIELHSTIIFGILGTCIGALTLLVAGITLLLKFRPWKYRNHANVTIQDVIQGNEASMAEDIEMQIHQPDNSSVGEGVSRESTLRNGSDIKELGERGNSAKS